MRQEQDVMQTLKTLYFEVLAMKSRQAVGSSSVATYLNMTNSEWDVDWTGTFDPPDTAVGKNYLITFTAERQVAPFASIAVIAMIDDIPYTVGRVQGVSMYTYENVYDAAFRSDVNQVQWVCPVSVFESGRRVRIKFKVFATDNGTVSVEELL